VYLDYVRGFEVGLTTRVKNLFLWVLPFVQEKVLKLKSKYFRTPFPNRIKVYLSPTYLLYGIMAAGAISE
jgi:hypothetical protein